MLSTNIPLRCNKGRPQVKPYFQYPIGKSPGDFDPLPPKEVSFLPKNSLAYWILLEILPVVMGVIIFSFFLISSSFILYGVVRGFYTDRMLPRKRKILKKLGKLPEERRRKHFRRSKRKHASNHDKGQTGLKTQAPSDRANVGFLTADNLSSKGDVSGGESDELVRQVISFSTPPLTIGKNPQLPTVPKPLEIPGRPFPVLPDAPLRSRHAATSPIPKEKRAKPPPIDHITTAAEASQSLTNPQNDPLPTFTLITPSNKRGNLVVNEPGDLESGNEQGGIQSGAKDKNKTHPHTHLQGHGEGKLVGLGDKTGVNKVDGRQFQAKHGGGGVTLSANAEPGGGNELHHQRRKSKVRGRAEPQVRKTSQ
ncbi:uncharacterized protein LOC118434998 isoform X2 [Folsomia candida]|uniref:uncharacterized protein LOC118434998 isoform X2 n=1 Tax=Folsomia candida TaxID=158441 RepID=UPI0016053B9A|nr:uncharacterized protein LOC118434998 isoform X2 [Folsomia candida]